MAESKLLNLVTNTYFAAIGAADLMMKWIEQKISSTSTSELKHELKQAHSRTIKAAHDFRSIYYHHLELERIACMQNVGENYDRSRADENEVARLLLTYSDRMDESKEAAEVLAALYGLPAKDIPDGFLEEHFTLK